MSSSDGSTGASGGGAGIGPGPGGGIGGPGGLNANTTTGGEALRIIKTQLIPHPQLQQSTPLSMPMSLPSPTTTTTPPTINTPLLTHNPSQNAPISLHSAPNLSSLTPVAAKITHVKTTTLDGHTGGGGITISGNTMVSSGGSTIMTSGVSTTGPIKLTGGTVTTSMGGSNPIALNPVQGSGGTAIRAISTGGQTTQVRVVMPSMMPNTIIKQMEGTAGGRTQITAISASARTVSNTSITVARPVTQATYLPRAGVGATQMTGGVGVGVTTTGQRLVTPIRATTGGPGAGGTNVTGLTAAGNFVRGTPVSRNTNSPATTVISPANSTTWMAANNTGQVQLIRTIPQSRQRVINATGPTVSGTNVGTTATVAQAMTGHLQGQQVQTNQSTIQTVSSQSTPNNQQQQHQQQQQQQQTYVATLATVLPQRQPQATLVYSQNVAPTSQALSQPQQFNATAQRFVATQIGAATGTVTAPRQIRPIPLGKSFSAAKLNTTSISIRAPSTNLPQLTPTLHGGVTGATVVSAAGNMPGVNTQRTTTVQGIPGSAANVIPTTNLSTTRIIQLQQPGSNSPLIGTAGRLTGNVMLQPIIVNTSASAKLAGFRPPGQMATKVQPSLTITQLGCGNKQTTGSGGVTQQNLASNIQTINQSGNVVTSISAPISNTQVGANLGSVSGPQLVNVSQATQLLTTQNIVSSAGGSTMLPLAISTRNATGGKLLTGTITPINSASSITMGKVMTQAQVASSTDNLNNAMSGAICNPTGVYIHHAPSPRSHGGSSGTTIAVATSSAAGNTQPSTTVLTSTGSSAPGTFLPPGSTFYYESVPASSVQVSTGVLSLTTTTATSSINSQNQISSSTSNLAMSSLPFISHAGNNANATFAVVPSSGGRTISQVQIPVSSGGAGAQLQSMPLRFSTQPNPVSSGASATHTDGISVSQSAPQTVQTNVAITGQQIIIPVQHQSTGPTNLNSGQQIQQQQQHHQQQQQQHMVIPLQTSIKVTSGGSTSSVGGGGNTVVSNFLRKRESDGSPLRAAKNLAPTLLSMSSNIVSTGPTTLSAVSSSAYSSAAIVTCVSSSMTTTALTSEPQPKKDRGAGTAAALLANRILRADSPDSSDGSTTVSANSSPGVDQQIQERIPNANDALHFNPINELYPNHHNVSQQQQQNSLVGTPISSRNPSIDQQPQLLATSTSTQRLNGGTIDCIPRKKARRSTSNDSQHSVQSQASLSLPPPTAANVNTSSSSINATNATTNDYNNLNMNMNMNLNMNVNMNINVPGNLLTAAAALDQDNNNIVSNNLNHRNNNLPPTAGNKENAQPRECVLRRPRNCSLLSGYKPNYKPAYNHFLRYSDVRPREERRPTVIDLANQSNMNRRIDGWRVHYLRTQMEELVKNEADGYDELSNLLHEVEDNNNPEMNQITELLKANLQRIKVIKEGVAEAQNSIMKIFEHKPHVAEIINRCTSKRNFTKKREKS